MRPLGSCLAAIVAVELASGPAAPAAAPEPEPLRVVSQAEILAAMQHSTGYVLTATANGSRLQAEVVRRLIHEAQANDPARRPLLVGHREWYEAFLRRTSLTPSQAPLYARISYEYGQDLVVDYRRERVIAQVLAGPQPKIAANMRLFWPKAGKPGHLSYTDTLSDPQLEVSEKRLMTYRFIDYGDRLWLAEIRGLRGRPTTGALGALFAMIGEARVVESRSAVASDNVQVVQGRARKWMFAKTTTVTILPSGRGMKGVPPGRPDLDALDRRLEEPLAIRFRPSPGS